VSASRAYVRRLTKRRGANFSLGFRLLPPIKRRAVYAAYSACRVPDDIVDEADGEVGRDELRSRLDDWQREVEEAYAGRPRSAVTRALVEALEHFPIPKDALLGLVEGCRMDLHRTRYATFAELERYCELVAVTISDISLAIFGVLAPEATALGRHLAMALQLTNICRDVQEDLQRGRLYLPEEELAAHGVLVEDLRAGRVDTDHYRSLMAAQCRRARHHFAAANRLPAALSRDSRAAVRVMGGVYRRVLDRIAADVGAAFRRRVELPMWQRAAAVAGGLAGRPFVA
jgi:phytoene synthase